jgi:hypothetical protein
MSSSSIIDLAVWALLIILVSESCCRARAAAVPPPPRLARALADGRAAAIASSLPSGARFSVPAAGAQQWETGRSYAAGAIAEHSGSTYICVQPHASQPDWSPPAVPALWRRAWRDGAPWVQPLGGHDAYRRGDHVAHAAAVWESVADANVWEPGAFGWSNMSASASAPAAPPNPPAPEQYPAWRSYDGTSATIYQPPSRVAHGGKTWQCTAPNNVWEPGVYGWEEVR